MNNDSTTVLYCSKCGSTNVEIATWVNPNTHSVGSSCFGQYHEQGCRCGNCKGRIALLTLPELWENFSKISVNNDDEIEEEFLGFDVGASKLDVWHWFDERCPNNLHDDLMFPSNNAI